MTATIRVRRETRDRLSATARRTGLTADALIDSALAVYERELLWRAWDEAHNGTTPAPDDEDASEAAMFDRAADHDYVMSERTATP